MGVDVSLAVAVAKQRFEDFGLPGEFLRMDLTQLPFPESAVDIFFSEGVLHHTDSVENAIAQMARILKPGGEFLFYVYKKKAPVREFTDDYIRREIADLSNEEAWEAMKSLTKLGKPLGDLNVTVDVEEVPLLNIPKGKMLVQRLFYWYFCKIFYREDMTIDEMNHINFDWYRSLNCHRHTPEEIKEFCETAGLEVETMKVENASMTVKAIKA